MKKKENIYKVIVRENDVYTNLNYRASTKQEAKQKALRDIVGKQVIFRIDKINAAPGRVFLSRSEVADIYGVDPQTISNYVDKGVLKPARCSKGHMMFDINLVESLRSSSEEISECYSNARKAIAELQATKDNTLQELEDVRKALGININCKSSIGSDMLMSMTKVAFGQTSERMYNILNDYLLGKQIKDIASETSLTQSRVLQIINKAVWMISELRPYNDIVDELGKLKVENDSLKRQISALQAEILTSTSVDSKVTEEITDIDYHMYKLLNTTVFDLNISVRTLNGLKAWDIETLGDLVCYSKDVLIRGRGIGKKTITELDEMLEQLNLHFDMRLEVERLRKKFMIQTVGQ